MRAAERDLEAQGSGSDADRRCGRRGGAEIEACRYSLSLCRPIRRTVDSVTSAASAMGLRPGLLTKVRGPEYRDDLQYLRVWVSRVRRKLGARPGEPGRIKTFQGIGYLLDAEPARVDVPADGAHDHLAPHATAGTGQEDAV